MQTLWTAWKKSMPVRSFQMCLYDRNKTTAGDFAYNRETMKDFSNDIEGCLDVLHSGGTILYPTDTIWGIGCDATNAEAVEKVINIKNRPSNKSFVVLVASERDI